MVMEKTVTINRDTGKVLSVTAKTINEDATLYTEALSDFFISILHKNGEATK